MILAHFGMYKGLNIEEDRGNTYTRIMVSVYCDYNIFGLLREDYAGLQGING